MRGIKHRRVLGILGVAALTASALVLASSGAFARDPEIIVTAGDDFTATEGSQVSDQIVAYFTDQPEITRPQLSEQTCDDLAAIAWTATIDWGDGTISKGVIHCADGPYPIEGTHTYKNSGTFHIDVPVKDNFDFKEAKGTDTSTATISDRDIVIFGDNSDDGSYRAVEGASVTVSV